MLLLNFSHPFTEAQVAALSDLAGVSIDGVLDIRTQLDPQEPFAEQVRALVDGVGLSPGEWQTAPLLVNLPGHSAIAAMVLAEIHGRCGYFPAVVRLRPALGTTPPQFEVAEILNLQVVRDGARGRR